MKIIELTQGKAALIDDADWDTVRHHSWYLHKPGGRSKTCYAATNPGEGGNSKFVLMHRLIMGANAHEQVDHRDRCGLNNQRSNLRLCTATGNARHHDINRNNSSGFKGVNL